MSSRLSSTGVGSSVDAGAITTGTLALARLSGITTTQLDAAAGITSGQIAALDAAKITTGTLPLARLSGITTSQLSASAALAAGQIASVNPSTLTGSGTVPLAALGGITTTQLDAAAAITSAQIAALDAAKITSGTLPLGRLSGITTSQLDAAAAITSGQIAGLATAKLTGTISASQLAASSPTSGQLGGLTTSNLSASAGILGSQLDAAAAIASGQITSLAASKLTGTNTLPDGVLSTNVPLLNAANTFTAAQTISATVAGPLAQINNASTTGAGLVIGSTTVASAGAGKIAPALALTQTVPATANYGLLSVGGGIWDGSTTGKFASSANGCLYAGNAASGFSGNLLDLQIAGASKVKVDSGSNLTVTNTTTNLFPNPYIQDTSSSGPYLQFGSSTVTVNTRSAAKVGLTILGSASQTGDLLQAQDSASHTQFGICNGGSGGSPVWALRVRATANAESMAVAHTAGAATGKCIQVFDDAGVSLGYLALYA